MYGKVIPMLETLVQRNSLVDQRSSQDELLRDDPNSFVPTSYVAFNLYIIYLLILHDIKYILILINEMVK